MDDPERAIEYIFQHGKRYAKAKAERIYLEEYRKSLKALLMQRSPETAVNAQERDAYSHPDYRELLNGLKEAVEIEEEIRWGLVAAQARIEVWRSKEATARAEGRATV
jgi:LmbE family N-acetylglucosaminyl deacetylase